MDDKTSAAVGWLLVSAEPTVRLLARRDLLGQETGHADEILDSPIVRALLSGQGHDGGFGVHPYRKWTGAHWRLVSVVELGTPAGEPRAVRAAGTVLGWLTGREHRASIMMSADWCAATPPRRATPSRCVPGSAWPATPGGTAGRVADGLARARRRMELRHPGHRAALLVPRIARPGVGAVRVLAGHRGTDARAADRRAAELSLSHRLVRSHIAGEVIRRDWPTLRYPILALRHPPSAAGAVADAAHRGTPAAATPLPCWKPGGAPMAAGSPAATGGSHPAPCPAL